VPTEKIKSLENNKERLNARIIELQTMRDSLDHKSLENKLLLFTKYKEKTYEFCKKLIE
jgi:hypothetical protein